MSTMVKRNGTAPLGFAFPNILKGKVGRRTGIQLNANARRDSDGYEIFDDYWSDASDKTDDDYSVCSVVSESGAETNTARKKASANHKPSPLPKRMSSFSPRPPPSPGSPLADSSSRLNNTYTCSPTVTKKQTKNSAVADGSQVPECQATCEKAILTGTIIKKLPAQEPSPAVNGFNMRKRLTFSKVSAEDSDTDDIQPSEDNADVDIPSGDTCTPRVFESTAAEDTNAMTTETTLHKKNVTSGSLKPTEPNRAKGYAGKTSDSEHSEDNYFGLKLQLTSAIEMLSEIHQDGTVEEEGAGDSSDLVIVDQEEQAFSSKRKVYSDTRQARLQKSTAGRGKGAGSETAARKKTKKEESSIAEDKAKTASKGKRNVITNSTRRKLPRAAEQESVDIPTHSPPGSVDEDETVARRQKAGSEKQIVESENSVMSAKRANEGDDTEDVVSRKKAVQKRKDQSVVSEDEHFGGEMPPDEEEEEESVAGEHIESGNKSGKSQQSTATSKVEITTRRGSIFSSVVSSDDDEEEPVIRKNVGSIRKSAKRKRNQSVAGKRKEQEEQVSLSENRDSDEEVDVPGTGRKGKGRKSVKKQGTGKRGPQSRRKTSESSGGGKGTVKKKILASKSKVPSTGRGKLKKLSDRSDDGSGPSSARWKETGKRRQSGKGRGGNQGKNTRGGYEDQSDEESEDDVTLQGEMDVDMEDLPSPAGTSDVESVLVSEQPDSDMDDDDDQMPPPPEMPTPRQASGVRHSSRRTSKPREYWKVTPEKSPTEEMASHKTKRTVQKAGDQRKSLAGGNTTGGRKSAKKGGGGGGGGGTKTAKKGLTEQKNQKRKSESRETEVTRQKKPGKKSAMAVVNSFLDMSDPSTLYSTLMDDLDPLDEESMGQSYITQPSPGKKRKGPKTPQKSPAAKKQRSVAGTPQKSQQRVIESDSEDEETPQPKKRTAKETTSTSRHRLDDDSEESDLDTQPSLNEETLDSSDDGDSQAIYQPSPSLSEESEDLSLDDETPEVYEPPLSLNEEAQDSSDGESPEVYQPNPRQKTVKGKKKVKKVQLILPKSGTPGLRRSRRCRVGPTRYWMNERPVYEKRRSGGFVLKNVQTPYVPVEKSRSRRQAMTRKIPTSPTDFSIHGELDDPFEEELSPLIATLDTSTNTEVEIDCIRPGSALEFLGPTGRPATGGDAMAISKALETDSFSVGMLILRPLQEKSPQLVRTDTLAFHIIKGRILVEIHRTKVVMQKGGFFYIPAGNSYSLRNLRKEEAMLSYFIVKDTKN